MGRMIHHGGYDSSKRLASAAEIGENMIGADLGSGNGESARFLVRDRGVKQMICIDSSCKGVKRGRILSKAQGFGEESVVHIQADITKGLRMIDDESLDFVWGEDAWNDVDDREAIFRAAARIIKPGGCIAFTDWILGSKPMEEEEANVFPCLNDQETVESYAALMKNAGFEVKIAGETGNFLSTMKGCIEVAQKQFKGDMMSLFQGREEDYQHSMAMLNFLHGLATEKKIAQGMFVGVKPRPSKRSRL